MSFVRADVSTDTRGSDGDPVGQSEGQRGSEAINGAAHAKRAAIEHARVQPRDVLDWISRGAPTRVS